MSNTTHALQVLALNDGAADDESTWPCVEFGVYVNDADTPIYVKYTGKVSVEDREKACFLDDQGRFYLFSPAVVTAAFHDEDAEDVHYDDPEAVLDAIEYIAAIDEERNADADDADEFPLEDNPETEIDANVNDVDVNRLSRQRGFPSNKKPAVMPLQASPPAVETGVFESRMRQIEKELKELQELTPEVALANAHIIEVLASHVTKRSIAVTRMMQKMASLLLKILMENTNRQKMSIGQKTIDPDEYALWDETLLMEILAYIVRDYSELKNRASRAVAEIDALTDDRNKYREESLGLKLKLEIAEASSPVVNVESNVRSNIDSIVGENKELEKKLAVLTSKLNHIRDVTQDVYVLWVPSANAFIHTNRAKKKVEFTTTLVGTSTDATLFTWEQLNSAQRVVAEWLLSAAEAKNLMTVESGGASSLTMVPVKLVGKFGRPKKITTSSRGIQIRDLEDFAPSSSMKSEHLELKENSGLEKEAASEAAPEIIDLDNTSDSGKVVKFAAKRQPYIPVNARASVDIADIDDIDTSGDELKGEREIEIDEIDEIRDNALSKLAANSKGSKMTLAPVAPVSFKIGRIGSRIGSNNRAGAGSNLAKAREGGLEAVLPQTRREGGIPILERRLLPRKK